MSAEGVVLLHALARRPSSMRPLAADLRAAGFKTLAPGFASRKATIGQSAEGLEDAVAAFARSVERVHFIGHSIGGLVARACIAQNRPQNLGRVVTMGTPHGGSELAQWLARFAWFRRFYGPAFDELTPAASPALNERLGRPDYPLASIAGRRALNILAQRYVLPLPNDGTVSVAATEIAGMADHRVVDCDHFFLPRHAPALAHCRAFLTQGRFAAP